MVPSSFGCGSAVLATSAMLAPSAAAFVAIARPIPRLAPEMNMVLPERDMPRSLLRADVGGHGVGQRHQILRCQGDLQATFAGTTQHPVPLQRRTVDHGGQGLSLAQRRDAADDVAG